MEGGEGQDQVPDLEKPTVLSRTEETNASTNASSACTRDLNRHTFSQRDHFVKDQHKRSQSHARGSSIASPRGQDHPGLRPSRFENTYLLGRVCIVVQTKKRVISVSGKGGTGKTTLSALLVKYLVQNSVEPILVVDADPATNLPSVLGVDVKKTVGAVTDELKKQIAAGSIPPTVSKEGLLESWVFETLVEGTRFDILAMGRSEGEGCYCYVNNVLTKILDTLTKNYATTVMDMDAGLEHLSRRTERDVDFMLITSDPSKMGLETARRIKELVKEVQIKVDRICLVGNMIPSESSTTFTEEAYKRGLDVVGIMPFDPELSTYNIQGRSLLELPDSSGSYISLEAIARKLGL